MIKKEMVVTKEYLDSNPDIMFVFGDNAKRFGKGGAAALRDHFRSYGFITKKFPSNEDRSFYTIESYKEVFEYELTKLKESIVRSKDRTFLISKLGAGLANKYGIWEAIIKPRLEEALKEFDNVVLLWE